MASEPPSPPPPHLSPEILSVDWTRLREVERPCGWPTTTVVDNPHFHDLGFSKDIIKALLWMWAAQDATTKQRNSNPGLGNQISPHLANFNGGAFVTSYQNGDVWAVGECPCISAVYVVGGAIRDRYNAIGQGNSAIGHPVSNELTASDGRGRFQKFQFGVIYFNAPTGAFEVYGDILQHWTSLGSEKSWLGYPLTGELPISGGRMNSFENGQITWRAQDRHLEAVSYKDKILQKYNDLGGINSPLGLPLAPDFPVIPTGPGFETPFQGGHITVPLDSPTPSGVVKKRVELWWRALECQARQEGVDEMRGGIGVFAPGSLTLNSTNFPNNSDYWEFQDGQRIRLAAERLYSGPPALLLITSVLAALDDNPFTLDPAAFFNKLPTSVQEFPAPAGSSAADAAAREAQIEGAKFKVWANAKHDELYFFHSSDIDQYHMGMLEIHPTQTQPTRNTLLRSDDPTTVTWTHTFSATGVDDGDDTGIYAFYLELIVLDTDDTI